MMPFRYLLDRVATVVLGLDGIRAEVFADYSQWAAERKTALKPSKPKAEGTPGTSQNNAAPPANPPSLKKKLSYLESREYESIGQRIPALEEDLNRKRLAMQEALENAALQNAALQNAALKGPQLQEMYQEILASQEEINSLYERWMELEEKTR